MVSSSVAATLAGCSKRRAKRVFFSNLLRQREQALERAPHAYDYTDDDDFVHERRGNLYFWYYSTLAMFRVGGTPWERWNAAMLSEYFGGSKADYEAINANNSGSEFQSGTPYDGTGQHWTETRNRIVNGVERCR